MPIARKLLRNYRKDTALLDMMLEMKHLSGKYPDEMLGIIIFHLRTSTSRGERLRVRAALDGLIAIMPLDKLEFTHGHVN
jgi:hypothetical protein